MRMQLAARVKLCKGHASCSERGTKNNKIPTRDISLLIGCNVGSSAINPAATIGMTAVKILVGKVQTKEVRDSDTHREGVVIKGVVIIKGGAKY